MAHSVVSCAREIKFAAIASNRPSAGRPERGYDGAVDDPAARLLGAIQNELPLVERPFGALADRLEISEAEAIAQTRALVDSGVIRQLSAIFDTRRLGYRGMLVAARTPAERQDDAAAVFSAHPGVSHNYLREHDLNLWFTLTVSPRSEIGLERSVELLGELAGVEVVRPMPALRFFKIGVDLDIKGDRDPAAKSVRREPAKQAPPPEDLSDREIAAIRALQLHLPIEAEPFTAAAASEGFTPAELIELGQEFLRDGRMRRFSAVLAHRRAGFVQNGMGVWRVPEERLDECGRLMAAFRGVSHCYQRPTYPGWPYNLFSMTHGRSKADCEAVLEAVSHETGLTDYSVLYSTKEYKKTRVTYFTPEESAWERAHAPLLRT